MVVVTWAESFSEKGSPNNRSDLQSPEISRGVISHTFSWGFTSNRALTSSGMLSNSLPLSKSVTRTDVAYDEETISNGTMDSVEHKLMVVENMQQQQLNRPQSQVSFAADARALDILTTDKILEEHLDASRRQDILTKTVLRIFGVDKLLVAARKEKDRRASENFEHPFPAVFRLVRSTYFELVVGLLMCVNATLIGVQTSVAGTVDETEFYDIMEHVFTSVFSVEVVLRLFADGWTWLLNPVNAWDVALIFLTGMLPMWLLKPIGVDSGGMRLFSVIRVLRMMKLVRMVRMVPLFQILYHLVAGLLGSMRLLLFTYLLMGTLVYILAVFSVYWIKGSESLKDDPVAVEHFGTVPDAVLTLLQVATCDYWATSARTLKDKSWIAILMGVVVIMVVTLVLFNLITAVICNAALDRAKDDEEILAREKSKALEADIKELEDLFKELDEDGSGKLSHEEYHQAVENNQRVKAKFQLLGIGATDAEDIWELLVDEEEGEISVDSFTHVLHTLQGTAKAKHSFSVVRRIQRTNRRIDQLEARLSVLTTHVSTLHGLAFGLDKEVGNTLRELRGILSDLSICIPKEATHRQEDDIANTMDMLQEQVKELQ